jgi:Rhodopirellula transposase DDE domain
VAGDPMTGLRWTRRTTEKIAEQLAKIGVEVSASSVARILSKMKFSLRTNRKYIESGGKRKSGDRQTRDKQFLYIKKLRKEFSEEGSPIISIDCKKKELIGNFKNNGKTLRRESKKVNDHDFRSDADGIAVPYGIYDVQRNAGTVIMGTSRETPAFAADSIETWWRVDGLKHYPKAKRILILSDCGGGNSARSRVWKKDIQNKVSSKYRLAVTMCHFPPGASKWNPIEHRLFSEISKNWSGVPLDSYETAINYIRTTKTKTGLAVKVRFNKRTYETGEKVSDFEMAALNILHRKKLPEWNYTIMPKF